MATAMIASLMALGLVSGQEWRTTTPDPAFAERMWQKPAETWGWKRAVYDDVLILESGDSRRPPQCGLVTFYSVVLGRLPTGETAFLYQYLCTAGQPVPPVSGRCRIGVTLTPGMDNNVPAPGDGPPPTASQAERDAYPAKMIDDFSCTISSDSAPGIPLLDGPQRRPVRDAARPSPTSRPLTILRTPELAPTDVIFDDILVTRISDRPAAGSGYVTSWVTVTGVTLAGAPLTWAITYMSEGQPLPPVGGRCRFVSAPPRAGLTEVPALAGAAMIVRRFDCTISSDSPTIPPDA